MSQVVQKRIAVFRGLPPKGGRLPGGVAAAMRMAVAVDPNNTKLLSFAGDDGAIDKIVLQSLLSTEEVWTLEQRLAAEGYLAANTTFWPWAHDQERYLEEVLGIEPPSTHDSWPRHFSAFIDMNRFMTGAILASVPDDDGLDLVVHDYQLSRVPRQVRKRRKDALVAHVVHTSWGTELESPVIHFIDQFARGIASADVVSFHTDEWRYNYINHLITRFEERYWMDYSGDDPIIRRHDNSRTTKLIVHPIGIDYEFWSQRATGPCGIGFPDGVFKFLSVERADHTKAMLERFRSIGRYFELYPHRRGHVTWIQMAAPTRDGVPAFSAYWRECEKAAAEVNKLAFPGWQPLIWIQHGLMPDQLAPVYRAADGIASTQHMDGFGMVYAEAMASADPERPPVGILARAAGCFATLGDYAEAVDDPSDLDAMAHVFERAMMISEPERRRRLLCTQQEIRNHPLSSWAVRHFDELAQIREERKSSGQLHV